MKYNYLQAVKFAIVDRIAEEHTIPEIRELLQDSNRQEELFDQLWDDDGITGNASGSYTFHRGTAEEYVKENLVLCVEAVEECGFEMGDFGAMVRDEEWETLDVIIRCHVYAQAFTEAIEEYPEIMHLA